MEQRTTLQKQNRGKPVTNSGLLIKVRDVLYPLLMLLTGTKVRYRIKTVNGYDALPDRPIIFAANHGAFPDIPIMLRATGRRSYILSGKQNLAFLDWIFFVLNGVIWVDRKDKADMAASKEGAIACLKKGQSVLWYPEGTWNLTDNQLMMPMKWGVIDVARQTNAQIIPTALDYDRERMVCSVKFAKPMYGTDFDNNDEAIGDLRDAIATLRWELMCDQPVLHRANVVPEQLQEELYRVLDEYPPLDWAYESSCIYHPHPQVEIVPRNLVPRKENSFLFRKD